MRPEDAGASDRASGPPPRAGDGDPTPRGARRRAVLVAVTVVVLGVAVMSCGSGGAPSTPSAATIDRASFTARVVEREKLDARQADCVADYTYKAYQPQDIATIYEQGFMALPNGKWGEYAHALVGCSFHDQLVPGSTSAERK